MIHSLVTILCKIVTHLKRIFNLFLVYPVEKICSEDIIILSVEEGGITADDVVVDVIYMTNAFLLS